MLHVAKLSLKNRCWQGDRECMKGKSYNNKSYILYIYYNIYIIYKILYN